MQNTKPYLIAAILAIVLGAFLFVYGEFDDSPGGQLLGLIAITFGIFGIIK